MNVVDCRLWIRSRPTAGEGEVGQTFQQSQQLVTAQGEGSEPLLCSLARGLRKRGRFWCRTETAANHWRCGLARQDAAVHGIELRVVSCQGRKGALFCCQVLDHRAQRRSGDKLSTLGTFSQCAAQPLLLVFTSYAKASTLPAETATSKSLFLCKQVRISRENAFPARPPDRGCVPRHRCREGCTMGPPA